MNGEVKSPRILGRPMWSWAASITMCGYIGKDGRFRRPWHCYVMQRVLWPLCNCLTGHRMARGERGYGGGGMIDVFCAYCYFPWQIPSSEMPSADHLVQLFHEPTPRVM